MTTVETKQKYCQNFYLKILDALHTETDRHNMVIIWNINQLFSDFVLQNIMVNACKSHYDHAST